MTFVITQTCIDVRDQSCVDVCPVDCIHFEEGEDRILYIDPVECIDCGACVPVCPEDAIFDEPDLPEDQRHFTEINALWYQDPAAARAQVDGAAAAEAPAEAATAEAPAETATAEAPAEAAAAGAPADAAAVAAERAAAPQATAATVSAPIAAPTPHASKQDYRKAFTGLQFPTSKDRIVGRGRDTGGLDGEVIRILQQLPPGRYGSLEELEEMVRAVYSFNGVAEDALPV